MTKTILSLILPFIAFIPFLSMASIGEPVKEGYVEAQLISLYKESDGKQVLPAAVVLNHDAGWHTYWISTETGYAPTVDWVLPENWSVSEWEWPAPDIYATDYTVDYIYHDQTVFPFELTLPQNTEPGEYWIQAKLSWLMCEEVCIPAVDVLVELKIVVSDRNIVEDASQRILAQANEKLPKLSELWELSASKKDDLISFHFSSRSPQPMELQSVYFYSEKGVTEFTKDQEWEKKDAGYLLSLPVSKYAPEFERLTGVLQLKGKSLTENIKVDIEFSTPKILLDESSDISSKGLLFFLGMAFLGGMILNLMPCVFPVLGIKLMSVVSQSGASRSHIFKHSLVYTLGILLSFWLLTIAFLILRSTGEGLGWGFQLQSPSFVFFLALFFLLFALNMSGVFEIGQSAVGAGANLQSKEGLGGSFFSGALATLAATPCSAPFLGAALGAAVAKPAWEMSLIFSFVGLGLASPFMLLPVFPSLMKLLPRPGAWMETFKELMAFLLYATVAFLVWTLSAQVSNENTYGVYAFLQILFALVIVAMAAWQYGRWGAFHQKVLTRRLSVLFLLVLLVLASLLGRPVVVEKTIEWQKWEPGKAEQLVSEGHMVYVDFTARWCVTCQTNKAAVFSGPGSDEVIQAFKDKKLIALKADWTARDETISKELAKYGKAAVPFNLIYLDDSEPIELPPVLTPGIVLEVLESK